MDKQNLSQEPQKESAPSAEAINATEANSGGIDSVVQPKPITAADTESIADLESTPQIYETPSTYADIQSSGRGRYLAKLKILGGDRKKAVATSGVLTLSVLLITVLFIGVSGRNAQNEDNVNLAIPVQDANLGNRPASTIPDEFQGEEESLLVRGDIIGRGNLKISKESFATVIRTLDLTQNQSIDLPNESGTICLSSNNCNFAANDQLAAQAQLNNTQQAQINTLNNQATGFTQQDAQLAAQIAGLQNQLGQIVIPSVPPSSLVNGQQGAVLIQGATNQITVNTSGGVVTLTTPQDIATISSPTFASLLLTGNLNVGGNLTLPLNCSVFANGGALTTNGSGQVICSDDDGGGSGAVTTTGGTIGRLALFTGAQQIADSIISQALGTITVTGDLTVSGALTANTLALNNALSVGSGGTGATTFTAGGVLYGNGSGSLLATIAPSNGQVLLGNGTTPTFTSVTGDVLISGLGVTTIQPDSVALGTDTTGNYVATINGGNGISVVNAVGEGSSPGLSLALQANKGLEVDGNGLSLIDCLNGQILKYNGIAQWACSNDADTASSFNITGDSGTIESINDGDTVTIAGGNNITTTSSNPDTVTINTVNNPNFTASVTTPLLQSSGALSITSGGALTVGSVGQTALLQGSTTTITSNGIGNDIVLTSANNVRLTGFNCTTFANGGALTTDINGNIICSNDEGDAANGVTGTGSANRIALFTGANSIADSWILQNGSTLQLDATRNLSLLGGNFSVVGTGLFSGLVTANGGITVQAGQTFTFNGDAFTDLVGTGLTISSGSLQTTLGTSVDLVTEVNGILPVANGGTNINGSLAANGTLLIGNGTGYTLATLTPGVGINISNASGAITVTSVLGNSIDNSEIELNAVELGVQTFGNYQLSTTGGNGISVTGTPGEGWTAALGLGSLTADWNQTGAFDIVLNNPSSELRIRDASNLFFGTLDVGTLTADRTYILPNYTTGTGTICLDSGNCAGAGGGITGSGTPNRVAKFNASGTITDSTITDNGTNVSLTGNLAIQGSAATVGTSLQDGSLIIYDNGQTATIGAALGLNSRTYTLPNGDGEFCILQLGNCSGGAGGNAPNTAQYLTLALDGSLTAERVLVFNNTNFSVTDGGANGNFSVNTIQNINTAATPTFAGLTLTGNLGIGANSIQGTTATIAFTSFNVAANGNVTAGTYNGQTITNAANFTGSLTVAGLATFNGGLTVQAGQTFTFNGDAFTDLTGNGLQVTSNALTLALQANKGLEVDGNGLSLIDCVTDGHILKYSTVTSQWACAPDAGGSGVGDDVLVNGVNADGANFVNSSASATNAAVTWSLNSLANPDEISISIGAASNTLAGIITANAQTIGGDKTFDASLFVNGNTTLGNASGDVLTVQGTAVAIPNNLNFDSNTLFIDSANNRVGIGTATPAYKLDVSETFTVDGVQGGVNSLVTASPTVTPVGFTQYYGGNFEARSGNANMGALTYLAGVQGTANHAFGGTLPFASAVTGTARNSGTGTTTDQYALYGQALNTGGGTVTNAYGLYSTIRSSNASSVITNAYGIRVGASAATAGGSIGTNYGIYIDHQSAASTNYGLYFAGTSGLASQGIWWNGDTNLYRSAAGTLMTDSALTVSGLATFNGGVTIQAGQTFTFNGDAFTDLTGNGLQVTSNALTLAIQANKGLEVDVNGLSLIDCTDGQILKYNGSNQWACAADAGASGLGDDVLVNGANADGANFINTTASGTTAGVIFNLNTTPNPDEISLTVSNASDTVAGVVTTGTQTFGGNKTFNGALTVAQLLTGQAGATISGAAISLNDSSNFNTSINGGTSTGIVTIGNGAAGAIAIQSGSTFSFTGTNATLNTTGQLQLPTQGSTGGIVLGGDASLYRSAANTLTTDDFFNIRRAASTDNAFAIVVDGDTFNRFNMTASGVMSWGDGTGARDTNLYRSAANTLATDDALNVRGDAGITIAPTGLNKTGTLTIQGTDGLGDSSTGAALIVGTGTFPDFSIFTGQVTSGTSTERIRIGNTGNIALGSGFSAATKLGLSGTGSANGITLGDGAADPVNLYRSAANTLRTDDSFNIQRTATDALVVQQASAGSVLLRADTSSMRVTIDNASGSLTNRDLEVALLDVTTTIRVGTNADGVSFNDTGSTNGASGKFRLSGTARNSKTIKLTAEYAGLVLDADGSNNIGTVTSAFDATQRESYYNWSTTQATNQDYDFIVQIPLPSDFDALDGTNPITINRWTSNTTDGTITATLLDTSGNAVTNWNTCSLTPGSASTWTTTAGCTISTGTYAADGVLTLRIKMQAPQNGNTRIGNITINYLSKF